MSKGVKILIIVVVFLVVAVVGAWLSMDYAAKRGIEYSSTRSLGVETKLQAVWIKPFSSSVTLKGLQIANPPGYAAEHMLDLDQASLTCRIPTLLKKEVVVDQILLDGTNLNVEVKGVPPKTNFGQVMDQIKKNRPAPEQRQAEKQYKIGLIHITNTKVNVRVEGRTADGKDGATITLPPIELHDVKNADGSPVILADVVSLVFAEMGRSVVAEAKGAIPGDALSDIGKSLEKIPEELKKPGLFKGLFGKKKEQGSE